MREKTSPAALLLHLLDWCLGRQALIDVIRECRPTAVGGARGVSGLLLPAQLEDLVGFGSGSWFGPEIGQFGFAFGFAFGFGVGKGLMPAEARGQARGHLLLGGEHLEHVLRLCYPRVEHVLLLRQAGWR